MQRRTVTMQWVWAVDGAWNTIAATVGMVQLRLLEGVLTMSAVATIDVGETYGDVGWLPKVAWGDVGVERKRR